MLGEHLKSLKGYEAYGAMSDILRDNKDVFLRGFFDSHPWGTPAQTIARATELAETFGTNEIMFVFKYGSMPIDKARAQHGAVRRRGHAGPQGARPPADGARRELSRTRRPSRRVPGRLG